MPEDVTRLRGHWYAALSSGRHPGVLELAAGRYRVVLDAPPVADVPTVATQTSTPDTTPSGAMAAGDVDELDISDRLGDTVRRIRLPDGALFESSDNATLDGWLSDTGHGAAGSLGVHRLESSWPMIATSLLVTVLLAFAAFRWGLPAASEAISDRLPVAAHVSVGRGALATMDRFVLKDSEIEVARQDEIRARFDEMVDAGPDEGFPLQLHFRRMGSIPNAFALPGGDVVVTDRLVALVEHPEELDSVLLHEIGHVHERHGMRNAIQASTVTLILALALGDVGGLGELATAVPVFMLQSSYTRKSESEADEYAFARMLETGRDPKYFASFMRRLAAYSPPGEPEDDDEPAADPDDGTGDGEDEYVSDTEPGNDWLSTHPDSERRALRAEEVSRERALE